MYAVRMKVRKKRNIRFYGDFGQKMPEKGRIAIYDSSWYRKVLIDRFEKKAGEKEVLSAYDSIQSFERQLTDDGMVLINIFVYQPRGTEKAIR